MYNISMCDVVKKTTLGNNQFGSDACPPQHLETNITATVATTVATKNYAVLWLLLLENVSLKDIALWIKSFLSSQFMNCDQFLQKFLSEI